MATIFKINEQQVDGVKKVKDWIQKDFEIETLLYTKAFGEELVAPKGNRFQALTTSQIRNFFGEVRRIQMQGFDEVSIMMLKPRLAYASKRKGTDGSRDFEKVMQVAIDAVLEKTEENEASKEERFKRFANFFEAVLAYHRANGGS